MIINNFTLDIGSNQFPPIIRTYHGDRGIEYRFAIENFGFPQPPGEFGTISYVRLYYKKANGTRGNLNCWGETDKPTLYVNFELTSDMTDVPGLVECIISIGYTPSGGTSSITSTNKFYFNVENQV